MRISAPPERLGLGGSIAAPKLASVVARRIEDDVVAQGWPVGAVLGSETELLERFGVSRAVLREAVRIVEHTGVARMRRGPGGGLVVTEPNRGAVVAALGVWLSYVGATVDELMAVRQPLLAGAVRLAVSRRDRPALRLLEARLEEAEGRPVVTARDLADLEGRVASLGANPALTLFVEAIGDLALNRVDLGHAVIEPALTDETARRQLLGYRAVAEAVARRDASAADEAVQLLSGRARGGLRERSARPGAQPRPARLAGPGPEGAPAAEATPDKLAERVARALRADIEEAGWPVGSVIGSETELIDRYGVSRAILREGVRILEHHGAVRTKRGPRGGLIVTRPDSGAIARSARIFLEYEQVTAAQLIEARAVLEGAAVRAAAERRTPAAAAALRAALDAEGRFHDAALRFPAVHRGLADAGGNRVFGLFVDVMMGLVAGHTRPERRSGESLVALSLEVHRAHRQIVEAVAEGDADLAERRLLRHLRASVDVLD